jgi:tRNA-dihydrouridine synthase B
LKPAVASPPSRKPDLCLDLGLPAGQPWLALAPMQDVTDLPFWKVMAAYGGPDLYFTEYFRVHPTSTPDKYILRSITGNPTGKPVIAQMIGNDIVSLARTARQLQEYPISGIDLNLGCPAPVVYRKCAGGGLLRLPKLVDSILGALREAVHLPFTVKTRVGFDSMDRFDELLEIFARHSLDLLTVHGRTVQEMYRSEVHYDLIARAVQAMPCPVLANGNVSSAAQASGILNLTGARGLMAGRGAIRNPWLFRQIRQQGAGDPVFLPTGWEVLGYIETLYHTVKPEGLEERTHVQKMKKYLNYIGLGIEPSGQFLHQIRRAQTEREFFSICRGFLAHDELMPLEPYPQPLTPGNGLA